MLVGVPGRADGLQRQPTQIDLVPVAQSPMWELAPAGGRGQHRGAIGGGQMQGTGEEVGVQVGVRGERHRQTPTRGGLAHRPHVPRRIDHQSAAVAQVQQPSGVAQALVQHPDQLLRRQRHRLTSTVFRPLGSGVSTLRLLHYSTDLWRMRWVTP